MALEATVEQENRQNQYPNYQKASHCIEEDDDPNATIPSSPTLFMKQSEEKNSLHHLPTMLLPKSTSSPTLGISHNVTSNTLLGQTNGNSHRRLSISSQDSLTSDTSNGGSPKQFACTVGSCEKKFQQAMHLRSHERPQLKVVIHGSSLLLLLAQLRYEELRFNLIPVIVYILAIEVQVH
ncbi:hypothetical protein BGZ76_006966 [Entomortierella beljakovae]|nr:hypothetical protein BGZ76_006966 [Entomortierella beljakovae]